MNWHSIVNEGIDIVVVGATGAAGEVLLRVMTERPSRVRKLRPLASARAGNAALEVRGERVGVERAGPQAFAGAQFAVVAAIGGLSKALGPEAAARGTVVIDKSNTSRMDASVPLV